MTEGAGKVMAMLWEDGRKPQNCWTKERPTEPGWYWVLWPLKTYTFEDVPYPSNPMPCPISKHDVEYQDYLARKYPECQFCPVVPHPPILKEGE